MTNWTVPMLGVNPRINFWEGGAIRHGATVAIDTETRLIDEERSWIYPEVAVLTAYSGGDIVDLVEWGFIPAYLKALLAKKTQLVFHNAPFDIGVLGLPQFIEHIDKGLIIDTGLQWVLRKIATVGLSDENREYPSLARVIQDLYHEKLNKDGAIRLTFTPGMKMDKDHAVYACGDAVATWKAAMLMGPQGTLDTQVRGHLMLDLTSRNGMLVDQEYMEQTRLIHEDIMNKASTQLLSWGIKTSLDPETGEIWKWMTDELELPLDNYESAQKLPVTQARNLVYKALGFSMLREVKDYMVSEAFLTDKLNPVELIPYAGEALNKKQCLSLMWRILDNLDHHRPPDQGLRDYWDSHQGWPVGYKQRSAQSVMMGLLEEAEKVHSIVLPRTKSGQISTSDDALMSVPDEYVEKVPFLNTWKDFKHAEKMISTYLDPKYIKVDGRIRPRFCPLVATGRSSARGPNTQNPPNEERLREHYIADPGYVINSCDYGQQELVTLAQDCFTRYGFSRMREVINLGIDIHGYVATEIRGLFKDFPEFNVEDLNIVKMYTDAIKKFKKEEADQYDHLRKLSKALNFG